MTLFSARVCLHIGMLLVSSAAQASPKASYQHYLKAVLHANQGNFIDALREYDAALKLDPQSSFIHQQAAELALEAGMTDKALALADRFVALSPGEPQAYILSGNVHWARGELKQAQEAFEKALSIKPGLREALLSLGNLLGAQSPEMAKKYLKDYLATYPDNAAEAEYQLALIEQRAGRNAAAAEHLKASHKLDPNNVQPLLALAQVYEISQDSAAALETYLKVLEREPRNAALLTRIGEIYFARGETENARQSFAKAKEISPGSPAVCLWTALLAEQAGDYSAAADSLRESAAIKEEPAANLRLSYYLTQAGRLKEAVEVLEAARAKWPASEDIAYFLALGYDDVKQPQKAVPLLREAISRRPGHRDARFQLGAIYEKSGDMARAEEQFREILKANPDDASALNYLGYSLADRGVKLDEAERLIRRAVDLQPNNGAYVDSLGWVLFRLGRPDQARESLERAAKLISDDETLWDHRGEVYQVLKDTVTAWSSWRRSLAVSPSPAVRAKLAKAERILGRARLGELYLNDLALERGDLASFGGPCAIAGEVAGRKFSFNGIVHFRAPSELSIEVLGPMFAPMFRVAVSGPDGFVMDPLRLEGIDQGVLQDHLQSALRLVNDYLAGEAFRSRPANWRGGWKGPRVQTEPYVLSLDKQSGRLFRLQSQTGGYRLNLGAYRAIDGHSLPTEYRLEGKGFSLGFQVQDPQARFR